MGSDTCHKEKATQSMLDHAVVRVSSCIPTATCAAAGTGLMGHGCAWCSICRAHLVQLATWRECELETELVRVVWILVYGVITAA